MLMERLASVEPDSLLDVGCGRGDFAKSLGVYCGSIVAIDPNPSLVPEWCELRDGPALQFCCMDGACLFFADNTFPLVLERDALHHTTEWMRVIDEMVRVSSGHVLIEEPIDDLRSPEKRNTYQAQRLFLELQAEVGYPHYLHLTVEELVSYVRTRLSEVEVLTSRSDARIPFEHFFGSFERFAARSARESYWRDRLEAFRTSLGTGGLCEADRLLLAAMKPRGSA